MNSHEIVKKLQDPKAIIKQQLIDYFDDLKPSSAYIQEITKITIEAESCLKEALETKDSLKKPAICFDYDDTIASHYPRFKEDDFRNDAETVDQRYRRTDMQMITPVQNLYQKALDSGVEVFVISYRKSLESNPDKNLRPYIIKTLSLNGITLDDAHLFVPEEKETGLNSNVYKSNVREKITEKGYNIIFSMGDQPGDVEGENVGKPFKLPNPLYGPFSWLGTAAHVTGSVKSPEPAPQTLSLR